MVIHLGHWALESNKSRKNIHEYFIRDGVIRFGTGFERHCTELAISESCTENRIFIIQNPSFVNDLASITKYLFILPLYSIEERFNQCTSEQERPLRCLPSMKVNFEEVSNTDKPARDSTGPVLIRKAICITSFVLVGFLPHFSKEASASESLVIQILAKNS